MKNTFNNFIDGIGNTPLIRLNGPSELTGCNIYGKAEFLNPGGSVKDRAACAIIKDAEEKKLISKGGTIVEGTAGNTGFRAHEFSHPPTPNLGTRSFWRLWRSDIF